MKIGNQNAVQIYRLKIRKLKDENICFPALFSVALHNFFKAFSILFPTTFHFVLKANKVRNPIKTNFTTNTKTAVRR